MVALLETLRSDPNIGVVGPSLWHGDRLLSIGGRDIAHHGATHIKTKCLPERRLEVDYVSGTVALVANQVFERVGLFDEDYFFSGEMADLCLRARQHGFRCVTEPKARANHDVQRSSKAREILHVYYIFRNRFLYIHKHYPRNRFRLNAFWIVRGAYAALKALSRGRRRKARAICLGVIDGCSGRFGGQNDRVLG
jgi:GT2 family glycosyltransferase